MTALGPSSYSSARARPEVAACGSSVVIGLATPPVRAHERGKQCSRTRTSGAVRVGAERISR